MFNVKKNNIKTVIPQDKIGVSTEAKDYFVFFGSFITADYIKMECH